MPDRWYAAIDLKSFYASAECMERGLDPLTTHLVVADPARTGKTICLAVSPSLKRCGLPGRCRLFEVEQKVEEVNRRRLADAVRRRLLPAGGALGEGSCSEAELAADPARRLEPIVAVPRMKLYMELSTRIFGIYLRFIAPEDIHIYSVDECFIDLTGYLATYGLTPRELTAKLIHEVYDETGITATGGVGTNLYLAKVAMDILAKHAEPDETGARIAELNERTYRERLWTHTPLTDFWRIGPATARKLEKRMIFTMGDIARISEAPPTAAINEEFFYRMMGVNAELLIDHAWGWEPCTIADIKAYSPQSASLSSGQVLSRPYAYQEARIIVREMAEQLSLDLVRKHLVTDLVCLSVNYDAASLDEGDYTGDVTADRYGRTIPVPTGGTVRLKGMTASSRTVCDELEALYLRVTDPALLIRRIGVGAAHVLDEKEAQPQFEQLDLFAEEAPPRRDDQPIQQAVVELRQRFGKNIVFRAMDLTEGATGLERGGQVGGHKA